jgi:hypothetical protein
MLVTQIDTQNTKQVHQFLDLPFQIYKNIPQWVPPISSDAWRMLARSRHPFYKHSEAAFFLAYPQSQDRPIGRLAVLDNRVYNQFNQANTAFFYLFECEHNQEASQALFESGFEWARQRGLNLVFGPKGFTALDGFGLLVEGFEYRPALGIPYNPPYYPTLVEGAGFEIVSDAVSGYLDESMAFPPDLHRAAELIKKRRGLHVARFTNRSQLREFVPHLKELYNGSLQGTSGNAPLTDEEVKSMANQILWFADPRLIKIIYKDETPVGFLLAYPDISAALQRTRGKLFPFGWIDVLLELRKTKWINLNGAGIVEQYRGLGGTALLFSEMYKSVEETRYRFADLVQIGLENDRMQRELRDLGIQFYKKHRVYQRAI